MNSISHFGLQHLKLGHLRLAGTIAASLLVSACSGVNVSQLTKEFDYYWLDAGTGMYCKAFADPDLNKHCKSIVPTNFHSREVQVIENIYQQQITGPNRILSLMNIITSGDNLDYQPVQLANNIYQLPINQQTDTVWEVLIKIDRLTHLKK